MRRQASKYILTLAAFAACGYMVFGTGSPGYGAERPYPVLPSRDTTAVSSTDTNPVVRALRQNTPFNPEIEEPIADSILPVHQDSLRLDSLPVRDTARKRGGIGLSDVISGKNRDSLVYDLKNKMVYIYNEGDVTYQDMNLKADYMEVDMASKNIYAHGVPDSIGKPTRSEFTQKGSTYTVDSITYNINSGKALIKGVATQEGEGFLLGRYVKRMPDNTVNIMHGMYTTCDHIDHPHFYIAMNRAKVIPGKKVIMGRAYFVMEDVPIVFPFVPFGFFPLFSGPQSGFVVPSFGEDGQRGFYLRGGGYYFTFNDYVDLSLTGGIYTLGSWELQAQSQYLKRYKYSGSLSLNYAKNIFGEKEDPDYSNSNQFSVTWSHRQDAKANPGSTFSASVNFSTQGYSKYNSQSVQQSTTGSASSSISYSRNWAGTPFSMTVSGRHSQNMRDSTYTFMLPSATFNMSRVQPFKRKNRIGKARWYEEISMTYSATMENSINNIKQDEIFSGNIVDKMRNGIKHSIPVNASFNLLGHINVTPNFNYNERWYFRKMEQEYDPVAGRAAVADTTYGFYRVFDYSYGVSMNTKIYGMYQMKNQNGWLKAVRHVITPTVSFSMTPDFGKAKYGYWKPVQSSPDGSISYYSPYSNEPYGVPSRGGKSASMTFSLVQNLEAKIRSDRDTTGMRKIKIIDNLTLSTSYDFVRKKLSNINYSFRTPIYGNYVLQFSGYFDPYMPSNSPYAGDYTWKHGQFPRLASLSTSFSYSVNKSNSNKPTANDITTHNMADEAILHDPYHYDMDPMERRARMVSQYYDFSIPWNFGFNFNLSYTNNGVVKQWNPTMTLNFGVNLTEKWALSIPSISYDFKTNKLAAGAVTITRDLHCWQMSFTWNLAGYQKGWDFRIGIKSAILKDIKYDRHSSRYDTDF